MHKFFIVIARIIAAIFAILFVITTILSLLLTTINRQMFSTSLYKNALTEKNFCERLPEIVGAAITSSIISNPCSQDQLACNIDGASPELQACLINVLGQDAYEAIGSGQRSPTNGEFQLAQPCLDQYGSPQTDNPQTGTSGPGGMPSFMQNLTAADWQAIITILLPPQELQTMTESMLDQVFVYLNGETDTVTVPLNKLKERLLGPTGTDLILQLLNSQPPCTGQELAQIASGTSNGGMVLCQPPKDVLPALVSLLQDQLKAVVPKIPDKATIIKPPAPGVPPFGTGPFGADPITTIRIIRLIMLLSPLLPMAFLLLVTLFAVRSFKSWMRWWGIPIFVSGTIALGLGVSAQFVLNVAWTMLIIPRIPPFIPADIAGTGQELVRSIVHVLSGSIVLPAIILLAVGLAAWIGSYFIKIKNSPDASIASLMPSP
jgi:hypothetical protein